MFIFLAKILNKMSLDFIEEVYVKEEYVGVESEIDFNHPLLTPHLTRKCGEVFLDHRGNFTFVCAVCRETFPDLRSFGAHIRDVHLISDSTVVLPNALAEQIPRPLKTEPVDQGSAHPEQKVEEKPIGKDSVDSGLCQEGDQSEDEPTQTKRRRWRRRKNKSYCCFSCGKIFVGFDSYRKHYRSEHPDMIETDDPGIPGSSNQGNFVPRVPNGMLCKYCINTFEDPATYHTHIQTAHTSKLYSCPHCPKTFKNGTSRNYHTDTHEGKKPYQCSHCPKAFSHPTNLKAHINMHLNIKPYACQYCDNKYTQKSDLKIHERIHTKEKPFQCDECGISFNAQVKLTNHVRRHKNIRNYKCPSCQKAFFNSRILRDHMITHTEERPYSCNMCDQKFRAGSALRSHKMLHSQTKRYECKLCGKTFAQYPGLYSHLKSHGEVS